MGLEALNDMTVSDIETTPIGEIMVACGYSNGSADLENEFRDAVVAAANAGKITKEKKEALTRNDTTVDSKTGGKRGKKGTKKRKEPSVLASWRKFVRKVQHEEKITYPEAMKRASKRKSEWQRGGSDMGEGEEGEEMEGGSSSKHFMKGGSADAVQDFDGNSNRQFGLVGGRSRRRSRRGGSTTYYAPEPQMMSGGSRRRRGTKKRRGSRRR
jgi:hypothetical protein